MTVLNFKKYTMIRKRNFDSTLHFLGIYWMILKKKKNSKKFEGTKNEVTKYKSTLGMITKWRR